MILLRLLLFVPVLAWAQAASHANFPSKPVRMIVPFPAGGPADIFGRGLAQGLTEQLGQPVIIQNVGGVGGVLGVDRARKSAPAGDTLGFNTRAAPSTAPDPRTHPPHAVK